MSRSCKSWVFGRGAIANKNKAYFATFPEGEDEEPQEVTQVINWVDGDMSGFTVPWQAKDLCISTFPQFHGIIMDPFGSVLVSGPEGNREEEIDPTDDGPAGLGMLRELRAIGKHVYAVGMHRQCYRRECGSNYLAHGKWVRMDRGVVQPATSDDLAGFNSIDGFSEDDMYAVGWKGEIWHYERKRWKKCASGTNLKLERVVCGGDGNVYAVGQAGILVRGRDETWEIIEQDATTAQFWGATWHNNRLWLATEKEVFSLKKGDQLETASLPVKGSASCGWLIAADGVLWSIGTYHLFSTSDGKRWNQIFIE